ncbi:MAG: hypothetical protein AB7G23_19035 [Vicinamibacterales bacterium]
MRKWSYSVWRVAVVAAFVVGLVGGSVDAATLTATWNVVPRVNGELEPSPAYDCSGEIRFERNCQSLWENGLELYAVHFSFYDDKWVDGYGVGEVGPGGSTVQGIRPRCEPTLRPCFPAFSPRQLVLEGAAMTSLHSGYPNFFIVSSRGGLVALPDVHGLATVNFQGAEWRRLAWMEIGFYLPLACADAAPPDDVLCEAGERALIVQELTYDSVPEPALASLVAVGVLVGLLRPRLRRRRSA